MSEKCPTCGEEAKNLRGLSIHHGKKHPDQWENMFWYRVDDGDEDECWEWVGSTSKFGYGRMMIDGDQYNCHRLSYKLCKGEIEDCVLHKCNNPACCNPEHLYDGDKADNMQDCIDSGNFTPPGLSGEDHPNSKLSEEDVLDIVEKVESGRDQTAVAGEYGVSNHTVNDIINGRKWNKVTGR